VPDGREADLLALDGECSGDVGDAEPLSAQGEDGVVEGSGHGVILAAVGDVPEERGKEAVSESGGEDEEGTRSVAEPTGGLGEGDPLEEVGSEGLVASLERVGGLAEEARGVGHERQL
jgi:hypothetical protein